MHGISVHSALAIKRQRRRRELAEKKKKRRRSSAGSEFEAARARAHRRESVLATKVIGTVTMFHIGVIFTIVGFLLLLGPLLLSKSTEETAELIGTGIICLLIGVFLIILNRIYGKREDQDLEDYVTERLARSQSGGRFGERPAVDIEEEVV